MVPGFVIFVDQEEQTGWFAKANVSDEADFVEVSISKDDISSVSASFKSGKENGTILEKQML